MSVELGRRKFLTRGSDGTIYNNELRTNGRIIAVVEKNSWDAVFVGEPFGHIGVPIPMYWPGATKR